MTNSFVDEVSELFDRNPDVPEANAIQVPPLPEQRGSNKLHNEKLQLVLIQG
jgi:hypothetical protein